MNKREEFLQALLEYGGACQRDGFLERTEKLRIVMALFDAAQPSQDGLPELPAPISSAETYPAPDGISQETWNAMSANDRGQFLRNIAFTEGWKAATESAAPTLPGYGREWKPISDISCDVDEMGGKWSGPILVWIPDEYGGFARVGQLDSDIWLIGGGHRSYSAPLTTPTHWMPLPASPIAAAKKEST